MASIAANLLLVTVFCMAVFLHGSQQMPVRSVRTTCTSPVQDRDLLLGLDALFNVFISEKNSINVTNLTIEIRETSDYKVVADSLCSLMMYSDFLAAAPNTSAATNTSTRLQAMQLVLNENVMDGCSLLKLEASRSNDVNFTTEAAQNESGDEASDLRCTSEELTDLRTYCVEQSFLQLYIRQPFYDINDKVHSDCLNGPCSWINSHFVEPERSVIINSTSTFNCKPIAA